VKAGLNFSPQDIRDSIFPSMSKGEAPFGTVLGYAPGGVPCHSSNYPSIPCYWWCCCCCFWLPSKMKGQSLGIKWQCVEFARRWLLLQRGYVFESVPCAYNIFDLTSVTTVPGKKKLPMTAHQNGASVHPRDGCLLIWNPEGKFSGTGHVAIITKASPTWVRIAEQNFDDLVWPTDTQDYARELPAEVDADGKYWIRSPAILGWMLVDEGPKDDSGKLSGHLLAESKAG